MKKSSKDVINYIVIHNNYMTNLWFKCRLAELEEGENISKISYIRLI